MLHDHVQREFDAAFSSLRNVDRWVRDLTQRIADNTDPPTSFPCDYAEEGDHITSALMVANRHLSHLREALEDRYGD